MVVRAVRSGSEITGLRVGVRNARRYFAKRIPFVELHLGHLRIECGLAPDFWRGRPEIHDSRLNLWLKFKNPGVRSCRVPIKLTMSPSGKNTFRLEPSPRNGRSMATLAAAPVSGSRLEER